MSIIKNSTGYTLVELMVVIAVIGILATIGVVGYNSAVERGKVKQAQTELSKLASAVDIARFNSGLTLREITGVNCTRCSDLATYHQSIDKIGQAAKVNMDDLKDGDPWGVSYAIDENEGEYIGDPCRDKDLIYALSKVTPQDAWNRQYPEGLLIEIPFSLAACS